MLTPGREHLGEIERQPGGAGGFPGLGTFEGGDGAVGLASPQAQAADTLIRVGGLGGESLRRERSLLEVIGGVLQQFDDAAEGGFGLAEVAQFLAEGAEVVGDGQADVRPFLQVLAGEGLVEGGAGVAFLVEGSQLPAIKIPGVVIAGVEFQNPAAAGQGVLLAVEGDVERDEGAADGRRVRVEAQGLLVGLQCLGQAVLAFLERGQPVEFERSSRSSSR